MRPKMKVFIFVLAAVFAAGTVHTVFLSGLFNNTTVFLAGITAAVFCYGLFFDKLKKLKWLTALMCTGIAVVAVFVAFLWIYGNRATTTFDEEVVIVLGAGSRDGEVLSTLAWRLDAAVSYHRQNPEALIIVSGGLGHQAQVKDAYIMAQYLIDRGVDPARISLEYLAYSTYTNMRYSQAIIREYFDHEPSVAVITSNFHMYRSIRFARQAGMDATMYPATVPWYSIPLAYVREVASVVKMWLIGR
ncbi:MAG: YdcF family protein [Defluviitaleaceae bacterium]|nr:YdcF family protein [Defluviitaleaceae bacterium]